MASFEQKPVLQRAALQHRHLTLQRTVKNWKCCWIGFCARTRCTLQRQRHSQTTSHGAHANSEFKLKVPCKMNRATSTACLKRFKNCFSPRCPLMISPICTRRHSLTVSSPLAVLCPMRQTFHDSPPTLRFPGQIRSYAGFFITLRRRNWITTSLGFWTMSPISCKTFPRKRSAPLLMHKPTLKIRLFISMKHFSQSMMPHGA